MIYCWETKENVLHRGKHGEDKYTIFVPNLKLFMAQHREIKFKEVEILSKDNSPNPVVAYNEDKSICWIMIDGINNEEEWRLWADLLYPGDDIKRYGNMRYNLARCCWNYSQRKIRKEYTDKNGKKRSKPLVRPSKAELCANNEELFKAFQDAYKAGFSFTNCQLNKIYNNVCGYDAYSLYSALMYYEPFPSSFEPENAAKFKESYLNKRNYYGEFVIYVENYHPYLNNFVKGFTRMIFEGWFNNIDIAFIDMLCGIKAIKCRKLYKANLCPLSVVYRGFIENIYTAKNKLDQLKKQKELTKEEAGKRQLLKYILEKFYGNCLKTRFYKKGWKWDEEKQDYVSFKNKYDWEEVNKGLNNSRNFEYSIGIWICSYARLFLLTMKTKLGDKALYGDIDSVYVIGDCEDEVNQIARDFFGQDFFLTLGKMKCEGHFDKFKVVDKKWYIGVGKEDFKFAAAGVDHDIVENYLKSLDNPIEAFSKIFPEGVNPRKGIRIREDGVPEEYWFGGIPDYEMCKEMKCIVACAGAGKTTAMAEHIKARYESTEEPIIAITFTNQSAIDLKKKIKEKLGVSNFPSRIIVNTIDSLAQEITGHHSKNYEKEVEDATWILTHNKDRWTTSHLYVDEFQDLNPNRYAFICALPCYSRYYIGDPNQSIYGYSGTVNFFNNLEGFTMIHKNVNYRCPQNINDFAEDFLEEKFRPHAKSVLDYAGEINFFEKVPDDGSVILCRTRDQRDAIKKEFPKRLVMTAHSSKGLTFDKVSVVGFNTRKGDQEDNLAYVACTRARKKLNLIRGEYTLED